MAFVNAFVPVSRGNTSLSGHALDTAPATRVATVRMATGKEPSAFGKAGESMWKENVFTGGMPGGETFYQKWVESGMTVDVPDLPQSQQATSDFKPEVTEKTGVDAMLDKVEFFKGFSRDPEPAEEEKEQKEETATESTDEVEVASEDDAPNESLYAPYFPANVRYLAPDIKITYEKDYFKDRVSLAMTEVTASVTDRCYAKDVKNKAPMIEISYNGNLANAYVSVKLDYVESLPTLPPPPKQGDAVTTLSPGSGGGLKLNYAVEGTGAVNI